MFLFAGFADENLYGTEIPFRFMLQFFRLVPFAKALKKKEIYPFCLVVKIGSVLSFELQALHGSSEFFYGTEILFCFTLAFFRLVPSAKALKTEKEIYPFCLIVKIGSFFICKLCMVDLNIFMEQRYFLASRLNSSDWFTLYH